MEPLPQPPPSSHKPLRQTALLMLSKLTGTAFQSFLSIFACIIYVIGTYYSENSIFSTTIEYVIAGLFALDYLWGFMIAKDKRSFMLNPLNVIDLVTIFPALLNAFSDQAGKNTFTVTRILRIIRVLRILRLYRIFTSTKSEAQGSTALRSADVRREILITIGKIVALLFISTGIVHSLNQTTYFNVYLPNSAVNLSFDTAFYYMIITILTIGYGDIYPITPLARAMIGMFVIIVIVIMSQQTTKLSELVKNTSPYRKEYKTDPSRHIVISGTFSGTTLFRFLKELYHPDHNITKKSCKVLIVKDEPPSKETLSILNNPQYEQVVQYLEGDLIDEKVLKSSSVKVSKGVFILTDQYLDEVGPSDTYAILAASSVKEYFSDIPVFLQLVRPDLLIHSYWVGWDSGFSTWQLKLNMLAANVFTPGFGTLVCNLIVSSSGSMKKSALKNHWINEYIYGLSNEVYLVDFPDHLVGSSFLSILEVLYEKFESLLIGVQTVLSLSSEKDSKEILINPVGYVVKPGDKAFIITSNLEKALKLKSTELETRTKSVKSSEISQIFSTITTAEPIRSMKKGIDSRHLLMWESDLRGLIWNHILIFGRIQHLEIILESFEKTSNQIVCYVSDLSPDENWQRISQKNKEVLYFECSLTDIDELSHTGINFACHAIILASKIPGSEMEDSGTLPLVNLIEHNFSVNFTVELVDEVNMKYMEHKMPVEVDNVSFLAWPQYAAGNVFCSSALDYITAQGYHNHFIVDLIRRLILYEDLYLETGVDENYRINSVEVPAEAHGKTVFRDIFKYLIHRERPVIALAIYRGVGYLNNDLPYIFTKPDFDAVLFKGDKIIVMGELNNRDTSVYLKNVRQKLKKQTTINLSRKKSTIKAGQSLMVQKTSIAEIAVKHVEEDEKLDGNVLSDEDLVKLVVEVLEKNKRERDVICKQNRTLMNLSSEYGTMLDLINGFDIKESVKGNQSFGELG